VSLLTYPTVGAYVASRRPKNPVGWLLCGVGLLFGTQGFAMTYAGYALSSRPGLLSGEKIALWTSNGWFTFPLMVLAAMLIVLLFPDGRLPARSLWALIWVAVGGATLWTLWWATKVGAPIWLLRFYSPTHNPFLVGGPLGETVEVLGRLGTAVLLVSCVASMISVFVRLGDSRGDERQQIKWFAYAAAALLVHSSFPCHSISDSSDGRAMGVRTRNMHLGRPTGNSGGRGHRHPQISPLRHR
jgi:hypothetical protein